MLKFREYGLWAHGKSFFFNFLETKSHLARLAWNSAGIQGRLWTTDPHVSTYQVMGFQVCPITSGLLCVIVMLFLNLELFYDKKVNKMKGNKWQRKGINFLDISLEILEQVQDKRKAQGHEVQVSISLPFSLNGQEDKDQFSDANHTKICLNLIRVSELCFCFFFTTFPWYQRLSEKWDTDPRDGIWCLPLAKVTKCKEHGQRHYGTTGDGKSQEALCAPSLREEKATAEEPEASRERQHPQTLHMMKSRGLRSPLRTPERNPRVYPGNPSWGRWSITWAKPQLNPPTTPVR